MTDIHVVPEALRMEAERVRGAAGYWEGAHLSILNTMPMPQAMLGGKGIDIVKKLQACAESLCGKLVDGTRSVDDAADKLSVSAKHFEEMDAEYYTRFGYVVPGSGN